MVTVTLGITISHLATQGCSVRYRGFYQVGRADKHESLCCYELHAFSNKLYFFSASCRRDESCQNTHDIHFAHGGNSPRPASVLHSDNYNVTKERAHTHTTSLLSCDPQTCDRLRTRATQILADHKRMGGDPPEGGTTTGENLHCKFFSPWGRREVGL